MFLQLPAFLQGLSVPEVLSHVSSGTVPAVLVLYLTKKHSKDLQVRAQEIKEVARKEFEGLIPPALSTFKEELLDKMNGTYLRTAEARVRFDGIEKSLGRIEAKVDQWE